MKGEKKSAARRSSEATTEAKEAAKNAFNYHLSKPQQGPKLLALKNHFIAMVGEFVGTVLFLIFALGGTNVANMASTSVTKETAEGQDGSQVTTANTSQLLFIALSFGFSLAVNAWIFFRVSGGLFNPAVSLGMVLVQALDPLRGLLLTVAQILGGIVGSAIIYAITPGTLNVRTTLAPGVSVARGLFIEMFLTSLLMLAILLLAAEKHKATFIAPIGIGLALFVAELFGVYYTGGSLNPARSFGPAVALRTFNHYHWIYWVGPGLGAVIAAGFYKMLKYLQYETVLGPEADGAANELVISASPDAAAAGPGADLRVTSPGIDEEAAIDTSRAKQLATMAVSGPGLGDLLTNNSAGNVYDLDNSPTMNAARLDRIEKLLHKLLGTQQEVLRNTNSEDTAVSHDEHNHQYPQRVNYIPQPQPQPTQPQTYDRSGGIEYATQPRPHDHSPHINHVGQPLVAPPVHSSTH